MKRPYQRGIKALFLKFIFSQMYILPSCVEKRILLMITNGFIWNNPEIQPLVDGEVLKCMKFTIL